MRKLHSFFVLPAPPVLSSASAAAASASSTLCAKNKKALREIMKPRLTFARSLQINPGCVNVGVPAMTAPAAALAVAGGAVAAEMEAYCGGGALSPGAMPL